MTIADVVTSHAAHARARLAGPVFDVHAHTGTDVDGASQSATELLAALEAVDARAAIFPLHVRGGYQEENARVLREARQAPDRLVAFARIDPDRQPTATADTALRAGARGLKLHPRAECFRLEHPGVEEAFAVAQDARVPVLIHAGRGVGALGPALVDLARRFRDVPMILAHAAISDLAWLWRSVDDHPNLYFDTAWPFPADLLALFALVPPERILLGSDPPYGSVALGLVATLRCAEQAGLSGEARELVAGGQAARLLAGEPAVATARPARPTESDSDAGLGRVQSMLTASVGALVTGGDPRDGIELALLAVDHASRAPWSLALAELLELALQQPAETRRPALMLALQIAATPAVPLPFAIAA